VLCHLRMTWLEKPDGSRSGYYADPKDPANWIPDPCSWCGGESFRAHCPGCGHSHRHGGIHRPDGIGGPGYGYLCQSPECRRKAEQEWRDFRQGGAS
jgi:hypothetical protein